MRTDDPYATRKPTTNCSTGTANGKKVRVEIGLKDDGGKPIEADLSVSVTDRRAVRYDFLGN